MTGIPRVTKPEVQEQLDKLQAIASRKPSDRACASYRFQHSKIYGDVHFYLLQATRPQFGLTTYALDSATMHNGNILQLLEDFLAKGTFVSLRKTSPQEYARNGGGNCPCCLSQCTRCKEGLPLCFEKPKE